MRNGGRFLSLSNAIEAGLSIVVEWLSLRGGTGGRDGNGQQPIDTHHKSYTKIWKRLGVSVGTLSSPAVRLIVGSSPVHMCVCVHNAALDASGRAVCRAKAFFSFCRNWSGNCVCVALR
jgi:hypothetical protein